MKNLIIAKIDNHIIQIEESEYDRIFEKLEAELKEKGLHWDDGPVGSYLYLCRADEVDEILKNTNLDPDENIHYYTKKILMRKGGVINKKFDLKNYIKRSWEKPEKPQPYQTTKERLESKRWQKRFWAAITGVK